LAVLAYGKDLARAGGPALRSGSGGLFAAISLDLWRALRLRLYGIADRLSQHLAQLRLCLCGFPLGWLPLGHASYVGMLEAELNPDWDCPTRIIDVARTTDSSAGRIDAGRVGGFVGPIDPPLYSRRHFITCKFCQPSKLFPLMRVSDVQHR